MLSRYLPEFVRGYEQIKQILNVEQDEIDILNVAVNRVKDNQFILFCDENGIERFEKMLGLFVQDTDTLESRRSRVYIHWNSTLDTINSLKKILEMLCGVRGYSVRINEYNIDIDVQLKLFGELEEVQKMLATMLPCNLVLSVKNYILEEPISIAKHKGVINSSSKYTLSSDLFARYNIVVNYIVARHLDICYQYELS